MIEVPASEKGKEMAAIVKGYLPAAFQDKKLHKVKDPSFKESLLKIEDQLFTNKFKFGVLYVKAGQKEENQFYQNNGGGY